MKKTDFLDLMAIDRKGAISAARHDWIGQGYGFKSRISFQHSPDDICYISEQGLENIRDVSCPPDEADIWTRNDILELCYDNEKLAEQVFNLCEWQSPATVYDEIQREEEDDGGNYERRDWWVQMEKLIELCRSKYSEEGFAHASRVADIAMNSYWMSNKNDNMYYVIRMVAMCHDLIEDTDCLYKDIFECFPDNMFHSAVQIVDSIKVLTHEKGISYIEYLTSIKESENEIAYIVKLADMKDHLMQKDTLTDRLKEKYLTALPYLL